MLLLPPSANHPLVYTRPAQCLDGPSGRMKVLERSSMRTIPPGHDTAYQSPVRGTAMQHDGLPADAALRGLGSERSLPHRRTDMLQPRYTLPAHTPDVHQPRQWRPSAQVRHTPLSSPR